MRHWSWTHSLTASFNTKWWLTNSLESWSCSWWRISSGSSLFQRKSKREWSHVSMTWKLARSLLYEVGVLDVVYRKFEMNKLLNSQKFWKLNYFFKISGLCLDSQESDIWKILVKITKKNNRELYNFFSLFYSFSWQDTVRMHLNLITV